MAAWVSRSGVPYGGEARNISFARVPLTGWIPRSDEHPVSA